MLIVDASCLFEVVAGTARAERIRDRFISEVDLLAPHAIDAEVLGVIRRYHRQGVLDDTAAQQAVEDLRDWPGDRVGHRLLLDRAWELRETVRSWDALYVALAEWMQAPLATLDGRLAAASGIRCSVEVL